MRSLTGAPAREYDLGDDLESLIMSSLGQEFIISISSKLEYEKGFDTQGIVPHHSFGIVSYKQVTHKEKKVTLAELVNPYAHSNWQGAWCASSPFWQDIGFEAPVLKPGHFWISTKDLRRLFMKI